MSEMPRLIPLQTKNAAIEDFLNGVQMKLIRYKYGVGQTSIYRWIGTQAVAAKAARRVRRLASRLDAETL